MAGLASLLQQSGRGDYADQAKSETPAATG